MLKTFRKASRHEIDLAFRLSLAAQVTEVSITSRRDTTIFFELGWR
jgi:hypothetical protein